MQLTVLGSASGGAFQGRNYSAQLLQVANETFLIDCGEGTQHQLYRFRVRYDSTEHIFISHLHGDHIFGLIGMLTSFSLKGRTAPMNVYGPVGLAEFVEVNLRLTSRNLPYPLAVHEHEATAPLKLLTTKQVEVSTIPLNHRVPCTGYLFRELPKQPNMRGEKIEQYKIPYTAIPSIKAGGDFTLPDSSVIPHHELVMPPSIPKSYAYCSDTTFFPDIVPLIAGVSLLYHEATFTDEHQAAAELSMHSTAREAAQIAKMAGVERLLIGHFSSRYSDALQHALEAREVFESVEAVEEGRGYEV